MRPSTIIGAASFASDGFAAFAAPGLLAPGLPPRGRDALPSSLFGFFAAKGLVLFAHMVFAFVGVVLTVSNGLSN